MPIARRLFARVLDTPGGMKIMTIHAFCQSLLRRFPLEAEVAPHFSLIEERDATALLGEARDEMLNAARSGADTPLRQALDAVVARMLEGRLNDLMKELFGRRARFERLIAARRDAGDPHARCADELRVGAEETRESVLAEAVTDVACNPKVLRRAADALAQGSDDRSGPRRNLAKLAGGGCRRAGCAVRRVLRPVLHPGRARSRRQLADQGRA